jgi:hypothetical protein
MGNFPAPYFTRNWLVPALAGGLLCLPSHPSFAAEEPDAPKGAAVTAGISAARKAKLDIG